MCLRLAVPGFLSLFSVLAAGAVAAAPAHYLVFSATPDGAVRPVFYRRVELAAAPRPLSEEAVQKAVAEAPRETAVETFALVDATGRTVFRGAVTVPTVLRGEFHGVPEGGTSWSIDGHRFSPVATAFVVRAPIVPGAKLVLDGHGKAAFDLDALARRAASLPLARWTRLPAGATKAGTGNSANRVDLLILGDGYTAAEQAKFATDAADLEGQFFSITPYREYRNHVKVSSYFVASAQSGADHPPYVASCQGGDNPSCCGDTDAQADPRRGTYVDTALDGRFCAFNTHRLAVVDTEAAFAAAAAVPNWDLLFVLINDPIYGGSGGSVSVATLHPDSVDVSRHELGHSFTRLADEYDTPYPGYPGCSDVSGSPRCEPNVTDETNRSRIKWAPWIAASTPVPTPAGDSTYVRSTGLFEGGRYQTRGMYRHRNNDCLMRRLGVPFGDVCSQEFVLRLYRGGWGVPAAGVDPIEPGGESPRPGAVSAGGPVTFSVGLLQPAVGPALAVSWWVDGVRVNGATAASYTYSPAGPGNHTVEVRVEDTTPLVHPALAGSELSSSRRWTLNAGAPAVDEITTPVGPDPRKSGKP